MGESSKEPSKDPSKEPTRRDFLQGKAAARTVGDWLGGPSEMKAPASRADLLVQFSRNAMATEFQVILNAQQHGDGPDAAMEALDLIERLEDQLTVYRDHSEVSQINRQAAAGALPVEWELFSLLETAVRLAEETGGAFDITASPLGRVWGFHQRRGRWPDDEQLAAARSQVGSDAIRLDIAKRTIQFTRDGCEINLGAIGKGFALDRAAETLEFAGVDDFLIHGGRSSVIAHGNRHGQPGWTVGLMHPLKPSQRLGELAIQDQAIGTSGCGNQFFHHQGRRLSHILDPRTGMPAEGVLSATVVAPSATEADALATALFVMGVEPSREYLEKRSDLAALFVVPGQRAGAIEIVTINLGEQWKPGL